MGMGFLSGVMEFYLILELNSGVLVAQLSEYGKNHRIVYI